MERTQAEFNGKILKFETQLLWLILTGNQVVSVNDLPNTRRKMGDGRGGKVAPATKTGQLDWIEKMKEGLRGPSRWRTCHGLPHDSNGYRRSRKKVGKRRSQRTIPNKALPHFPFFLLPTLCSGILVNLKLNFWSIVTYHLRGNVYVI